MKFYCVVCDKCIFLDKYHTINKCPKCYHDLIPLWV